MVTERALAQDPAVRRSELLSNPKVKVWHEGRGLRSRLSADNDLRKLSLVLYRLRLGPESIVATASKNPDALQAALVEYAGTLKRSGRTDAHIVKTLNALRNYLRFRRVSFDGYPKLSASQATTLERERIPTPEELGRVLERLPLRHRVVALFLAHTGVRPSVLGSYMGEGGLTLADLPELDVDAQRFREVPFVVRVPSALSKTRAAYTTFGTAQLAETYLAYMADRRESGEALTPTSPVIARAPATALRGVSKRSSVGRSNRFLWTHAITDTLAEALHAAQPEGVTWRVYTLRSYLSTRLMLGPMNRDLRESIMGHSLGSVSAKYNVGKRWGADLLAEARREYAASAPLLETNAATKSDTKAEVLRSLLEAVESATGSKPGATGTMTADDLIAALRKALGGADASAPPTPVVAAPRATQKVVAETELDGILAAGGRLVAPVGSRFCVEMPSGA